MKVFTARVPSELYKKISDAAEENNRSIMAEIVNRLKKSFNQN